MGLLEKKNQKKQAIVRNLEFSAIPNLINLLRKGLKMKLMIVHAYAMNEVSIKSRSLGFGELSGWQTPSYQESDSSQLQGEGSSCTQVSPLWISPSGYSSVCFIPFNQLVNVRKHFPEFCELIRSEERAAKSDGSCMSSGDLLFAVGIWKVVESSLIGLSL